jgi:hypothetical protein
MAEAGKVLTVEMLREAIELLESPTHVEYAFRWQGKVYTGPSYGECVTAAMRETFPVDFLRSKGLA